MIDRLLFTFIGHVKSEISLKSLKNSS